MRRIVPDQLPLVSAPIAHVHARELRTLSGVLDAIPDAAALVHTDLARRGDKPIDTKKGREGMTAEQVLRAFLIKQMNGFSYEELAFHLADSATYRSFCRLGIDQKPLKKSTLQKNIKRVRAETWSAINHKVVHFAAARGVENGRKVRTDCTVVASNIHAPTDSSLLSDCVRVLARLQGKAREHFGLSFNNHRRRARRRALAILNARSNEQRLPWYRDLLKVTDKTITRAEQMAEELDRVEPVELADLLRAGMLAQQLRHYVGLVRAPIRSSSLQR